MDKIIKSNSKRILVIGDVMLDHNIIGNVTRISPEAPVPIFNSFKETFKLGGAANVAAGIKKLGCDTDIYSDAAKDDGNSELTKSLKNLGIGFKLIQSKQITTIKQRFFVGSQQVFRSDNEIYSPVQSSTILNNIKKDYRNNLPELCVLSDYSKGVLSDSENIIAGLRQLGVKSIVDPKSSKIQKYKGAWILKPNWKEFNAFFKQDIEINNLPHFGKKVCEDNDIENLIITLGSKGIFYINKSGSTFHIETKAKEVFDVTGAGDTVIATLAYFINQGLSIPKSIELANYAASYTVANIGTYNVSLEELRLKAEKGSIREQTFSKITDLVESIRAKGRTIVFTNGCFDILHPGHIDILNFCKKQGDFVVVGLNSDKSVKEIKGLNRPINSFQIRKKLLQNLKAVDLVVEFDSKTPLELIKNIKPDILIKGGDYKVDEVVGADFVNSYGGEIIIFEFVNNTSTTKELAKIRNLGDA